MSHVNLSDPEGWSAWVHAPEPERPPKMTSAAYAKLPDHKRDDYDELRIAWHSTSEYFETPQLIPFRKSLFRLLRSQTGANTLVMRGAALSAVGNSGKTFAVANLLRNHQLELEERDPTYAEALPVVWSEASKPGEMAFYSALASSLDIPHANVKLPTLIEAVIAGFARERTQVLVIDEAQRLYPKSSEGEQASFRIRHIANKAGVVIILVGVKLEDTGAFSGSQASSTRTRLPIHFLAPYEYYETEPRINGQLDDQTFWKAAVLTMEKRLVLTRHEPKSLSGDAEYLWARTGGSLGALASLIQQAAYDAIVEAGEQITREVLDAITLDQVSEDHYAEWPGEKAVVTTTKASEPIGTNVRSESTTAKSASKKVAAA